MKIQILTQDIKNKEVMNQGLALAKSWSSTIGLNFEYSFRETAKQFTTQTSGNFKFVNPQEILDEADTSNKIACLLFDNDLGVTNPFQHPIFKNGCNPIQVPENWWVTFPEVLAQYFLHEICHSGFFFKDGSAINDITHNQHSYEEWTNKQPQEYYLHLLQGLKQYLETSVPPATPTLRLRSTNKIAIKEMQTLLNAQGGKLVVDGDFGNITLKALIAFQKSKELTADGICGTKTWTELKKKL